MQTHSLGEVSAGEAEDGQRRGYSLRHDLPRIRKLRRGIEDLPGKIQRGELRWNISARDANTNTTQKNLVARGEHQRPGQPGTEGEASAANYDSANSAVLGNPMDPSSEGATDFAGYSVAHQPEY